MQPPDLQTRIGTDEWVAQVDRRRRSNWWGAVSATWLNLPLLWRYGLVIVLALLLPWLTGQPAVLRLLGVTDTAFVVRTLTGFLIAAMLAIGLNVVVGYAGLLDLGYVAFYGIAGYSYAYLSSHFVTLNGALPNGIHLPTILSVTPPVEVAAASTPRASTAAAPTVPPAYSGWSFRKRRILSARAPQSVNCRTQVGPARACVTSSTLICHNGPSAALLVPHAASRGPFSPAMISGLFMALLRAS